jgi:hypothetical protein
MKPYLIPKSLKQSLALAGQLFLSHLAAGGLITFIWAKEINPALLCLSVPARRYCWAASHA